MSHFSRTVKVICLIIFGMFTGVIYAQESDYLPFAYVTQTIEDDGTVGTYNVHVVDVLSGNTLFRAPDDVMSCAISISPDGQWLVYESLTSPAEYILRNLTTGAESVLSNEAIEPVHWTDDTLFFVQVVSRSSGAYDLIVSSYDFTDDTFNDVRTVPSSTFFNAVRWYNQDYAIVTFNNSQFFVYRNDDDGIGFVNRTSDFLGDIKLSATTRLFSVSYDNSDGMILDTDDGLRRAIKNQSPFSWYHHSDTVTFIDEKNQIVIRHIDSSIIERFDVLDDDSIIRELHVSPDDSYIAYLNRDESDAGGYYILETATGEVHRVGENNADIARITSPLAWVDDTRLVYLNLSAQSDTARDVWMYNVTTAQSTQVTNTTDERKSFRCVRG